MRKAFKKLLASLLALAMVCALAAPVFAATTEDLNSHTFEVYQVFTGDVATVGTKPKTKLSNAKWGDGVDSGALLAALAGATFENTAFNTTMTPAEVVKAMENSFYDYDADNINTLTFARLAYANKASAGKNTKVSVTNNSITFNEAGYYLIVDTTKPPLNMDLSRNVSVLYLAKAGENITVKDKIAKPTVKKEVQTTTDAGGPVYDTSASYAVNDPFLFKLTATLDATRDSAYQHYTTYPIVFTDSLPKGISFDELVSVKAFNEYTALNSELDPSAYTLDKSHLNDENPFFTLTIKDLKNIKGMFSLPAMINARIEVLYKAHLNENADFSNQASTKITNTNKVTLTYPGDPMDQDAFPGVTPESVVYVASYKVENTKYADNEKTGKPLAGAEFKLYTDATCSADKEVKLYKYTDGNYYPINSATGKTEATMVSADTTGKFNICGLGTGTYYLKETKAPDGYNTCDLIEIRIIAPLTGDTVDLTNAKGMVNNIVDQSGVVLPSTGGIGTTIFYVVGGLLMVGAAVLLVTKKRMENN